MLIVQAKITTHEGEHAMKTLIERPTLPKGTRVQLHPATDMWMKGDRYGEVIGYGKARLYTDYGYRQPLRIKLDRSGKVTRQLQSQVTVID